MQTSGSHAVPSDGSVALAQLAGGFLRGPRPGGLPVGLLDLFQHALGGEQILIEDSGGARNRNLRLRLAQIRTDADQLGYRLADGLACTGTKMCILGAIEGLEQRIDYWFR